MTGLSNVDSLTGFYLTGIRNDVVFNKHSIMYTVM